jgi:hypothetical protein
LANLGVAPATYLSSPSRHVENQRLTKIDVWVSPGAVAAIFAAINFVNKPVVSESLFYSIQLNHFDCPSCASFPVW